jgi:signal-transduction protein with cAMP-binding, CBS, and nucleotidyltransferase domain
MLSVADIMTRLPVTVGAEATVREALDAMKARGISSVLVTPPLGSTEYGIVTMHDVVTKIVKDDLDPDAVRVGDIMTWGLVTAGLSWTPQQAAELMAKAGVRRLPVMEGSRLLGLVSDTDLFTALVPRQEWEHVRLVRKERAWRRASQMGPAKRVSDLMSTPVLTIGAGVLVQDAIEKMVASGVTSLLVQAEGRTAQGIITKRDVVTKVVARGMDPRQLALGQVMSSPVRTIEPDATVENCSARMATEGVRRFPVALQGEIVGIVSDSDILAAAAAHHWWGHRGRRWPTSYIVADVMRPAPGELKPAWTDAVAPELSLWECAAKLGHLGLTELPVVQEGRVIGVVRRTDILRAIEERGGAH